MARTMKLVGRFLLAGYVMAIVLQGFSMFAFIDHIFTRACSNSSLQFASKPPSSPTTTNPDFKFTCGENPFGRDRDFQHLPQYHFVYQGDVLYELGEPPTDKPVELFAKHDFLERYFGDVSVHESLHPNAPDKPENSTGSSDVMIDGMPDAKEFIVGDSQGEYGTNRHEVENRTREDGASTGLVQNISENKTNHEMADGNTAEHESSYNETENNTAVNTTTHDAVGNTTDMDSDFYHRSIPGNETWIDSLNTEHGIESTRRSNDSIKYESDISNANDDDDDDFQHKDRHVRDTGDFKPSIEENNYTDYETHINNTSGEDDSFNIAGSSEDVLSSKERTENLEDDLRQDGSDLVAIGSGRTNSAQINGTENESYGDDNVNDGDDDDDDAFLMTPFDRNRIGEMETTSPAFAGTKAIPSAKRLSLWPTLAGQRTVALLTSPRTISETTPDLGTSPSPRTGFGLSTPSGTSPGLSTPPRTSPGPPRTSPGLSTPSGTSPGLSTPPRTSSGTFPTSISPGTPSGTPTPSGTSQTSSSPETSSGTTESLLSTLIGASSSPPTTTKETTRSSVLPPSSITPPSSSLSPSSLFLPKTVTKATTVNKSKPQITDSSAQKSSHDLNSSNTPKTGENDKQEEIDIDGQEGYHADILHDSIDARVDNVIIESTLNIQIPLYIRGVRSYRSCRCSLYICLHEASSLEDNEETTNIDNKRGRNNTISNTSVRDVIVGNLVEEQPRLVINQLEDSGSRKSPIMQPYSTSLNDETHRDTNTESPRTLDDTVRMSRSKHGRSRRARGVETRSKSQDHAIDKVFLTLDIMDSTIFAKCQFEKDVENTANIKYSNENGSYYMERKQSTDSIYPTRPGNGDDPLLSSRNSNSNTVDNFGSLPETDTISSKVKDNGVHRRIIDNRENIDVIIESRNFEKKRGDNQRNTFFQRDEYVTPDSKLVLEGVEREFVGNQMINEHDGKKRRSSGLLGMPAIDILGRRFKSGVTRDILKILFRVLRKPSSRENEDFDERWPKGWDLIEDDGDNESADNGHGDGDGVFDDEGSMKVKAKKGDMTADDGDVETMDENDNATAKGKDEKIAMFDDGIDDDSCNQGGQSFEIALYLHVFGAIASAFCAHSAYRNTIQGRRLPGYLSFSTFLATTFGIVSVVFWSEASDGATESHWSFWPYIACYFYILFSAIFILAHQFCVDLRSPNNNNSSNGNGSGYNSDQPFVEINNEGAATSLLFPSTGLSVSMVDEDDDEHEERNSQDDEKSSKVSESTPLLENSASTTSSKSLQDPANSGGGGGQRTTTFEAAPNSKPSVTVVDMNMA